LASPPQSLTTVNAWSQDYGEPVVEAIGRNDPYVKLYYIGTAKMK
jgi:hypothetical protein